MNKLICIIGTLLLLSGCGTTYHVVPEVIHLPSTDCTIAGILEYEGNHDYLPRTIREGGDRGSMPVIRYAYHVGYGKDSIPEIFPLFNPLSLVGFPVGSDSLVIVGALDIVKAGETLKQYSATCVIDKNRSLFYEGDTFSELRKKGLFMVRENIETQMISDREFLSQLLQ